ncbi:hypothetical protein [Scytonema sp. NUACC26]|uniref:hypothetical protein n=1 Tax=Scytonema sp. NUACC26 TaxID=3140176 RepID=UPI0038B25926
MKDSTSTGFISQLIYYRRELTHEILPDHRTHTSTSCDTSLRFRKIERFIRSNISRTGKTLSTTTAKTSDRKVY